MYTHGKDRSVFSIARPVHFECQPLHQQHPWNQPSPFVSWSFTCCIPTQMPRSVSGPPELVSCRLLGLDLLQITKGRRKCIVQTPLTSLLLIRAAAATALGGLCMDLVLTKRHASHPSAPTPRSWQSPPKPFHYYSVSILAI